MKTPVLLFLTIFLSGCPLAHAYDVLDEENKCVIDQCDESTCSVETPEGWVQIFKKPDYYEGKKITCPTWLVEPT